MNKKFLIISSIYLYLSIFSSALFANTNNTIKKDDKNLGDALDELDLSA